MRAPTVTNLTAMTRSRETWPRHKAKARQRQKERKATARAAQRDRDRAAYRADPAGR